MKVAVVLVCIGVSGINAVNIDFTKKMARARLEKEGLPDPVCRTGIISLPVTSLGKKQACCPHYCKECDDYKSCESVRGQDSKNACCASKVLKMECGKGAPANVCLKKCSEALPPCIMEDGQVWKLEPPKVNAADDCNEAIVEWRQMGKAGIKAGNEAAEAFEAKMALQTLERVLKTHKKLVEETEETIKEVKEEVKADKASLKAIEGTIELLTKEIAKAVELHDFMAQALLFDLKVSLTNATTQATAAEESVASAVSDMEKAKDKLTGYLDTLKDHKITAKDTDPKILLDNQQDIDLVHEVAEEVRDLQFIVANDTIILDADLAEAEKKAKEAEEVVKEYLTTTTTTTTNLDCQCYHCGSNDEFNDADICGYADPGVCDANSPDNGGCWTERTEGCVCETHTIIQSCDCYHCGGSDPFPNADVCGPASNICGPMSPDNGGCWNDVPGATCQCSDYQTTGL
jgi:hypothetical protein